MQKNLVGLSLAHVSSADLIKVWESAPGEIAQHVEGLTVGQARYCELYVLYQNRSRAYREAFNLPEEAQQSAFSQGTRLGQKPAVQAYVRILQKARARSVEIDSHALVQHDLAIVEAAAHHANELTRYVWRACRYCHGVNHKYQWRDETEYSLAIASAFDAAAATGTEPALPDGEGGFGFTLLLDPIRECPQCGGMGDQLAIINDTTKLEGPAAALYRGVKQGPKGAELLMHDVDKAKERLLRVAGLIEDDMIGVAKSAAAGAAAGAAIAAAAAERAAALTSEQAARVYLEVMD